MKITFCGHSNFSFDNTVKEKLRELLLQEIRKNPACKFYLGGYGDFDSLCLNILKEIYNIEDITLFDMFPNTYHVESVVLLSLKNNYIRY